MTGRTGRRGWFIRLLIGGVVLAAIGLVGVPFIYTRFINDPAPRLTFENFDAQTTSTEVPVVVASEVDSDLSGTWVVAPGSEVGYRVPEVISGQSTEGVGRSKTVEGSVTVADGRLTSAEFSVDVASLKSDSARRDAQFAGRIMNAEEFPVASFTSTSTPEVALPTDGSPTSVTVDGQLALHGAESTVSVPVELRMVDGSVQMQGSITVKFADFGIDDPSVGPVKTGDTGLIEFLLTMKRS